MGWGLGTLYPRLKSWAAWVASWVLSHKKDLLSQKYVQKVFFYGANRDLAFPPGVQFPFSLYLGTVTDYTQNVSILNSAQKRY